MTALSPDNLARSATRRALLRAGPPVGSAEFAAIRQRLTLDCCKWDAQIGDVSTLADFPLVMGRGEWNELSRLAELLCDETMEAERRLVERVELHRSLGLPGRLRRVLRRVKEIGHAPSGGRIMRFDFHPTKEGWRISEVNSDVPGGYTEASSFTEMMGRACGLAVSGCPAEEWVCVLSARQCGEGPIVLLSATGFMEDQQIVAYLRDRLVARSVEAALASPRQLRWMEGQASLESGWYAGPVSLIVRFYQAEWLSRLSWRTGWEFLAAGGKTPVANPMSGILSESKRFPLVWNELGLPMRTWRRLLPETRDPRDAPWRNDDGWLLKTSLCNTGDTVCIREFLTRKKWLATCADVWMWPGSWVAQRRFEMVMIDTPAGPMYPCIGVYTIEGKCAGAYARLSRGPIVDFAAVDAALLIEEAPEWR